MWQVYIDGHVAGFFVYRHGEIFDDDTDSYRIRYLSDYWIHAVETGRHGKRKKGTKEKQEKALMTWQHIM